jgi:WD40 repeat protein
MISCKKFFPFLFKMTQLFQLEGHTGFVESASFSPDGTRVVTAGDDGTARIWSVLDGRELFVLEIYDLMRFTCFSPDGTKVVTSGNDNTVRIWTVSDDQQLLVLEGHEDIVNLASFSPDGTRVLTGSQDNTARIWNA